MVCSRTVRRRTFGTLYPRPLRILQRERFAYSSQTYRRTYSFRRKIMILVTGGTGLIGSRLLFYLTQNKAHKVRAIYRSTHSLEKVEQLFIQQSPNGAEQFRSIEWVQTDISNIPALEQAFAKCYFCFHCAGFISFQPKDFAQLLKSECRGNG